MRNDRLKFRAWDDENLCWVRPKLVENESGVTVDERGYELFQWTGLYDSACVEVYRGDILGGGQFVPGVIVFQDGAFRVDQGNDSQSNSEINQCRAGRLRVIGTEIEHPDLVERANG